MGGVVVSLTPEDQSVLGRLLWGMAVPGTRRVMCLAGVVGPDARMEFSSIDDAGESTRLAAPAPETWKAIYSMLKALRARSYVPGRGTWFEIRLWCEDPGVVDAEADLDDFAWWDEPPEAETVLADLEEFPRDEEFIPDWLRHWRDDAVEEVEVVRARKEWQRAVDDQLALAQQGPPVDPGSFDVENVKWWFIDELTELYPIERFTPPWGVPDLEESQYRYGRGRRMLGMYGNTVFAVADRPLHYRRFGELLGKKPSQAIATPAELVAWFIGVANTVRFTPLAANLTPEQRLSVQINGAVSGLQSDDATEAYELANAGTYRREVGQKLDRTSYELRLVGLEPEQIWVLGPDTGEEFNLADPRWVVIKDRQLGSHSGYSRDLPVDAEERSVLRFGVLELGYPRLERTRELIRRPKLE